METYTFLRQLADSWVLLILTLIFLGVIFWAFRPGSRPLHDDAAAVPFRNDDARPGQHRNAPAMAAAQSEKGNGHV
ncbi:cbb3-type cytochrome c oxidase subunit 3 [Roseovarius aquimarinus]|uniref:Cbb3-type cytochrome c oxidase subunit 3 n=1 Tax=Roseovarius aquimarinus TaxID=1229156 RepID=A0ABW7I652_9RHOB